MADKLDMASLAKAIPAPVAILFVIAFSFEVDDHIEGALLLGPKLIDEHYNDNDRELIRTLVNNLSIALQNARSIEEIKTLNKDLAAKNEQLEQAMQELKAALRKVEILESIKSNLCKFVPTAVTRLMESSPSGEIQAAKERDVSVLFLDIEGLYAHHGGARGHRGQCHHGKVFFRFHGRDLPEQRRCRGDRRRWFDGVVHER